MKKTLSENIDTAKTRPNGYTGDKFLRTREVLQLLKVSRATLRKLIFLGKLSPVMLGSKAQRFSAREVSDFVERTKNEREIDVPMKGGRGFSAAEQAVLNTICSEFSG